MHKLKKFNDVTQLDCTLRDGGYYNNWHFNHNLINNYLKKMDNLGIKFIEIGFLAFDENVGLTGNIKKDFFKNLYISKNTNYGVMINAKDIVYKNFFQKDKFCKLLKKKMPPNIKFLRFACNHDEVLPVLDYIKKNDFKVQPIINIMQITEIKINLLIKICKKAQSVNLKILYIADSFGSLSPQKTKKIINTIKIFFKGKIGIHAHDNCGLALKNSITAISQGAEFVDSTILGMGRGAGNLKTETMCKFINNNNKQIIIENLIKRHFIKLKIKYNWGRNIYYKFAAKNLIHPTYVQELLSNKIYKKNDYFKILNGLKNLNSKKYDAFNIFNLNYFRNRNNFKFVNIKKIIKAEQIIILGSGKITKKNFYEIVRLKNVGPNTNIISLNNNSAIIEKYIDFRVACHPHRVILDYKFHLKNNTKFIFPFDYVNKKILKKFLNHKDKKIYNYGMIIKKSTKKIYISKASYCVLVKPLVITYLMSILENINAKKIFFYGFTGFKKENPFGDDTHKYLKYFKKNNSNIKLVIPKINTLSSRTTGH
jgi:4-hydroxy 2-oxovalerate aldolase